jgi:acetyl esterase
VKSSLLLAAALTVMLLLEAGCGPRRRNAEEPPPKQEPATAQAVAAGVTVSRDVQFGTADGYALLLDAYVPGGPGPFPAAVVIHGGGWVSHDKELWTPVAQRLAQAGFAVFNVNYRLAPPGGKWHFPAAVDDVKTAVRWVRSHAATYRADPGRVGALGGSAGGNLALMLAATGQPGQDKVQVAVSWSGPTAANLMNAKLAKAEPGQVEDVESYIGCPIESCSDKYLDASPATHVDSSTAPCYLANSKQEITPVNQANYMADKLKQAGVPYQLRILDGKRHSIDYANDVLDESIQFLKKYQGG